MPAPPGTTVVITKTTRQSPATSNGCVGIVDIGVSGVAFSAPASWIYLEIKSGLQQFYSDGSSSYLYYWNYWIISSPATSATVNYSKTASPMYVYTGTPALSNPIYPHNVGLSDGNFPLPTPYPSSGYNNTFTQEQSPGVVTLTATIYALSSGALPGDPALWSVSASTDVSFSACSMSGSNIIPIPPSSVSIPTALCVFGAIIPSMLCAFGSSVPTQDCLLVPTPTTTSPATVDTTAYTVDTTVYTTDMTHY